jgi:hypothetical protein
LDRRLLAVPGLIVIGLAAFLYLHGGKAEHLTQSGGHVSGQVEGYQSQPGASVSSERILVVDYTVDQSNYRARINLDPSVPTYAKGQSVTVYYKPSDPTDVEVDGHGNGSTKKPVLPAGGLAVLGLVLIGAAFIQRR